MDLLQDSVRFQDWQLLEITQLLVVQETMETFNTLNQFWNKKCKFLLWWLNVLTWDLSFFRENLKKIFVFNI